MARRPNLLLLDEPTNHLDIDMRHALTVALQSFEGGLVVVSHDRHLIKTVADTLWLVADGKLQVFDGDLDDYQQWLKDRAKTEQAGLKPKSANKTPRDSLAQLRGLDLQARLAGKRARLTRDAASLEARWMEVGTAIEAAEAEGPNGG